MDTSIEYRIYDNLFKYIDILGYEPIIDDNGEFKKQKKEFMKTLQFYYYVRIRATKKDDINDVMYVLLIGDGNLISKSPEFKKILNNIPESKATIVLVSKDGLKTPIKKFLMSYTKKTLYVKNLLYDNFKVDARENVMVPIHKLCTKTETKKIMDDNKIDNIQLFPKIRSNDTQVLWLGGKSGQLIKIIRRDVTGEVLYYRVII